MFRLRSIKNRLIFAIIFLAIFPLALIGLINIWHSNSVYLRNFQSLQKHFNQHIAGEIVSEFRQIEQDLYSVQRFQNFFGLSEIERLHLLEELLSKRTIYRDITLIDFHRDKTSCSSNIQLKCPPSTLEEWKTQEAYLEIKGTEKTFYGAVKFDPETGVPFMKMAIPLKSLKSGDIWGMLVATLELQWAWDYLANSTHEYFEHIYIIDAQNRVIIHANPSIVLSGTPFEIVPNQTIQKGLGGDEAVITIENIILGKQVYRIVFEYNIDKALVPMRLNKISVILLLLADIAGAFIIVVIAKRELFVPLRDFRDAIREIIQGNYSRRIVVTSGIEIEQLADSFNHMAENLQNSLVDLERTNFLLNSLMDSIPDLIFYKDNKSNYLGCNKAFAKYLQKTKKEIIGKSDFDFFQKDLAKEFQKKERELLTNGKVWRNDEWITYLDGKRELVDTLKIPYFGLNNEILGLIGISRDMTERNKIEEELRKSLLEKDILLKEIHHRVKNNLQVISSLLYLQLKKSKIPEATDILKDSQNRIRIIALIHEKLYGSEDLSSIDFSEYIHSIVNDIFFFHVRQTQKIEFLVEAKQLKLSVNLAIPCALIINELVTNSIKHAFPNTKNGTICIVFQRWGLDGFFLSVSDNGIGIPAQIDTKNASSLGLRLIKNLSKQLQGNFEYRIENGTTFSLKFVDEPKKG